MKSKKPTTVRAAELACRKAFKGVKIGRFAWNVHHGIWWETLRQTPKERIDYILKSKYYLERVPRLNSFRPVKNKRKFNQATQLLNEGQYYKGTKMLKELHKKEVPFSTWNGNSLEGTEP